MNIVIFGCRKIAVDAINYIIENTDHKIICVVNHDEEHDRVFDPILVKDCCIKHKITSLRFDKKVDVDVIKQHHSHDRDQFQPKLYRYEFPAVERCGKHPD